MAKKVMDSRCYLPTELLIDIFLKLPVKTLIRCASISKSWHTLIRNPNFAALHINAYGNYRLEHGNNGYILFGGDTLCHVVCARTLKSLYAIPTPVLFKPNYKSSLNLVGSCNGLVCLSLGLEDKLVNDVYIWKPSIRTYKKLPPSQFHDEFSSYVFVVSRMGFGFHESTNDHKVIRLINFRKYHASVIEGPCIEVYSFQTDSWEIVHSQVPPFTIPYPITFHKGVFYWIAYKRMINVPAQVYILSFDLDDEKFREIETPLEEDPLKLLTVKGSSGSLFAIYSKPERFLCDVLVLWKMDECNKAWMKAYTIPNNNMGVWSIPVFTTSGKLVGIRENKLVSYDLKSLQTEVHHLLISFSQFAVDVKYMESLFLFDH